MTFSNDKKTERLWIRYLSCGHKRFTNIAFMVKNYDKPKQGDNCYCRECCNEVKIIRVEEAEKEEIEELKEIMELHKW